MKSLYFLPIGPVEARTYIPHQAFPHEYVQVLSPHPNKNGNDMILFSRLSAYEVYITYNFALQWNSEHVSSSMSIDYKKNSYILKNISPSINQV